MRKSHAGHLKDAKGRCIACNAERNRAQRKSQKLMRDAWRLLATKKWT